MTVLWDEQRKEVLTRLWLAGENVTETGTMNFFIVLKRDDGG